MKTGLVLEGGAMRGIYTAGVLDVFMEQGLHFDGVIGVSAGALHGCSFVSGQKGRSIRYFKKYRNDKHFMSMWNLVHTGEVVGKQLCYHDIPERLDPYDYEAFLKSDTEFYATCSNVETGKAEYIKITDMLNQIDVLRASASMPYVSKLVDYQGMKLLDGGCTDSIPLEAFRRMGFEKNVVILTQHKGYVKKPQNAKMAELRYHKYPEFAEALKEAGVFVIQPSEKLEISRMETDLDVIQSVYERGMMDARVRMKALKEWMEEAKR